MRPARFDVPGHPKRAIATAVAILCAGHASPAASQTPAASQAPVAPPMAHIRLSSPGEDVSLYVNGTLPGNFSTVVDGYTWLCRAPCEVEIPAGKYSLATSSHGSKPTPADGQFVVKGTTAITADHDSRDGLRMVGVATAIVGA